MPSSLRYQYSLPHRDGALRPTLPPPTRVPARFLRLHRTAATHGSHLQMSAGTQVARCQFSGGPQLESNETKIWIYPATRDRMLGEATPLYTLKTKLWHIVIAVAVCTVVAMPSGADDAAPQSADIQT